jgi:hypothetical protein
LFDDFFGTQDKKRTGLNETPTSPKEGSAGSTAELPIFGCYPRDLKAIEDAIVVTRRGSDIPAGDPKMGLALSGGGIRSATFCLGFLQGLAAQGILKRVDFLSTVSGGGYIGGFLGKWINATDIGTVERELPDSTSEPVAFLRENGRYLAPNGTGDLVAAAAAYLRSWLTCLLTLGVLGVAVFMCLEVVRGHFDLVGLRPDWVRKIPFYVELSPLWTGAAAIFLYFNLPIALGFWVPSKSISRAWAPWILVVAPVAFLWWYDPQCLEEGTRRPLFLFFAAILIVAIVGQIFAVIKSANWVRLKLTQALGLGLVLTLALAVLALIDSLVLSASNHSTKNPIFLNLVVALPGLLAAGFKFLPSIIEFTKKDKLGIVTRVLIALGAALAAIALFFVYGFAAHTLAGWIFGCAKLLALAPGHPIRILASAAIGAFFLAALLGRAGFWFVNFSSMNRLYSTRLTRAYLGASNPKRGYQSGTGEKGVRDWNMSDVLAGDDISYREYRPDKKGGPIHIISATVNETVSHRSNTEKRDRKGFVFGLGPAGVTAATTDHVLFDTGTKVKPPAGYAQMVRRKSVTEGSVAAEDDVAIQMMTLGDWIGISGAAVSTGDGARTNIATSFLLGFFNIRLGYWWDSGSKSWVENKGFQFKSPVFRLEPIVSTLFPAQSALISEYLAQFYGPERRRWYLTDGGHFENTAVYELIRRRIRLIVCCDCGGDAAYEFEDVGNLVRKARIDFGAEIEFLKPPDVSDTGFSDRIGSIDDLVPKDTTGAKYADRQIALAKIKYRDGSVGVLVIVKPSLFADCPVDIQNYAAENLSFPQQSTLEQFFDEAQWESHRKLGESISLRFFGGKPDKATAVLYALIALGQTAPA